MNDGDVIVFGANGMLGRYVSQWIDRSTNNQICPITRSTVDFATVSRHGVLDIIQKSVEKYGRQAVVNCAGVIKPRVDDAGVIDTIHVNGLFPHYLAEACYALDVPLIHITTDCVFDGMIGGYSEVSTHSPTGWYEKSKSIGEPDDCSVIRTSIIGEEVGSSRSLLEWVKSQAARKCNGFSNHLWNGLTCLQLAKVIEKIIVKELYWKGVRHIHSPNTVTKYELLKMINQVYDLRIHINEVAADVPCDRTLKSLYADVFEIPNLHEQVQQMKDFRLEE